MLVVDDEAPILDELTDALDDSGYHTYRAVSGAAAFDFIASGRDVDVVLNMTSARLRFKMRCSRSQMP